MKYSYDTTSDALYITLTKKSVHVTKKVADWLLLDLDKDGKTIGVEILEASIHAPYELHAQKHNIAGERIL